MHLLIGSHWTQCVRLRSILVKNQQPPGICMCTCTRSCYLPCRGGEPPSCLPTSHHQTALICHCGVWAEDCPALRGQWKSPDLWLVGSLSIPLLYSTCHKSVIISLLPTSYSSLSLPLPPTFFPACPSCCHFLPLSSPSPSLFLSFLPSSLEKVQEWSSTHKLWSIWRICDRES